MTSVDLRDLVRLDVESLVVVLAQGIKNLHRKMAMIGLKVSIRNSWRCGQRL